MPTTVSLADEEGVKRILTDTVFGLWDVVNNLTRLRPSRRERYRVTIFGSARIRPGTWVYEEVKRVAGERVQSVGVRVELPFRASRTGARTPTAWPARSGA